MKRTRRSRDPVRRLLDSFKGHHGKRRLLEAIRAQALVAGDPKLATDVCKVGELEGYSARATLFEQGRPDNDLFLILSGEVEIRVNGRVVATREAGTHVGEMAVVDPLARRSATVIAIDATAVLRLSEHQFAKLASVKADLWRRVAVEVSKRLRERNKLFRIPNAQPVVFVGSSSEGLKVAEAMDTYFLKQPIVSKLWSAGVFQASQTSIESLVQLSRDADFAILIFTSDDVTFSRGLRTASPRDNVVFELGLMMGGLGRNRVFILKPKGVNIRIPSDLLGVTWIEYSTAGPVSLEARLRPVCERLLDLIRQHGCR